MLEASPIDFNTVNGLLPGEAVVGIVFMGIGPCDYGPDGDNDYENDGREYTVLRPKVIECDLRGQPPIDCSVTSEPLTCADIDI